MTRVLLTNVGPVSPEDTTLLVIVNLLRTFERGPLDDVLIHCIDGAGRPDIRQVKTAY